MYLQFPLKEKKDCESKPDTGPCKGAIPRIYFDKTDKRCKKFIYGGCEGNKNNYQTEIECLETCSSKGNLKSKCNFLVLQVTLE